jgi:hypothetical protein
MYSKVVVSHPLLKRPVLKSTRAICKRSINVPVTKRILSKPPKAFVDDLQFSTYIIGKGIIVFTMFYCSLNWWYYRNLNEEYDKETKKNDEGKTKSKEKK